MFGFGKFVSGEACDKRIGQLRFSTANPKIVPPANQVTGERFQINPNKALARPAKILSRDSGKKIEKQKGILEYDDSGIPGLEFSAYNSINKLDDALRECYCRKEDGWRFPTLQEIFDFCEARAEEGDSSPQHSNCPSASSTYISSDIARSEIELLSLWSIDFRTKTVSDHTNYGVGATYITDWARGRCVRELP